MRSIKSASYPLFIFLLLAIGCKGKTGEKKITAPSNEKGQVKPPSSFQDTLTIQGAAAVFYYPDSIQIQRIRAVTDSMIFDGTMHEYFYMMKNAKNTIQSMKPGLQIIEARNVRYLCFQLEESPDTCIDLDKRNDAYGILLFDGHQLPSITDMANIDRELPLYFNK